MAVRNEVTLEDLYSLLSTVKSSKELTDNVVLELKNKVSDHDLAIVTMAKAVEDMNKTFTNLAGTLKEGREDLVKFQKETAEFQKQYQIEQVKHWSAQDSIMKEIRLVLDGMSKYEKKFDVIEQRQLNGCPALLGFKEKRNSDLARWEDVKQTLLTAVSKSREEIDKLTATVAVLSQQVKVEQNRVNDLEAFQQKTLEWKDKMYTGIITNGVALLGAIGLAIWNLFTKA